MKDFMWYFWRAFKNMLKVWLGIGLSFCAVVLIVYICLLLVNCVGGPFAAIIALSLTTLICAIACAISEYKADKERWR